MSRKDITKLPGLGLLAAFILAIIGLIVYVILVKTKAPEVILSPLLVLSVISLIVVLAFTAALFKYLGLDDKNQSLGLPEGSIRAVVALSLILIFMISSIFLYYQVATPITDTSKNVSGNMIKVFPNDSIKSITRTGTDSYDVEVMFEKTKISEDIAKQIITTVGTLVVAVAGFYFGARAVSVATGVTSSYDPLIRSIRPTEGKKGQNNEEFRIFGKNLGKAKEVKLIRGENTISCSEIFLSSTETEITCKLTIPDSADAGKWSVVFINADKVEDRLDEAFEIKDKTG